VKRRLSGLLFIATVLTTTIAGSLLAGANPFAGLAGFLAGLPFSVSLLAILGAHEMAHYLTSRRHGVKATWPLFIPAPFPPVGTFGALIRIKSIIPDRRVLLEIGVSGPVAGFLVALPLAAAGLAASQVEIVEAAGPGSGDGIYLGTSLVFLLLEKIVLGPLPENAQLYLHPVAFAAWFGFFVTAMNLIPIGQLDGGHVLYGIVGRRQRQVARILLFLFIPLGFFWPGWLFWGALLCFMGFAHPPLLDEEKRLGRRQKVLAWIALALLVLTFTPAPFTV
jgi:membrane-associated protease RseP (regulator of RpoE activity)